MRALLRLASGELARLDFGIPDLAEPTLDERLDAILSSRPVPLDELWDLPQLPLIELLRQRLMSAEVEAVALPGLLAAAGHIGSASFVSPAYQWATHRDPAVQAAALKALGQLQVSLTLGVVREALASRHPEVRREAIVAAGKLGDLQLTTLVEAGAPLPAELEAPYAEAIKRIPLLEQMEVDALHRRYLKSDDYVDLLKLVPFYWESLLLLALPPDSPPLYRLRALHLLAVRRFGKVGGYVLPALAREPPDHVEVRAAMVHCLGRVRYRPAVVPFLEIVRTDAALRPAAVEALGEIGDPRAAEPLLAIWRGADEKLRPLIWRALEKLTRRPMRPILTGALYPVETDRWLPPANDLPARPLALFDADRRLLAEDALEPVEALRDDPDPAVKRDADLYLSFWGPPIRETSAD